jgi:predicted RNase H-like HicB family nuclease
MKYTANLEKGETHWIARANELPAYAMGRTPTEALQRLPDAIRGWKGKTAATDDEIIVKYAAAGRTSKASL